MSLLKNKKIVFYLVCYTILIFLSGLFIGNSFSFTRQHHRYRECRKPKIEKRLCYSKKRFYQKLNLTAEQTKQLESILEKHQKSIEQMRSSFKKDFKSIKDQKIAEINSILTSEQKGKFSKIREKRNKKYNKKHKCRSNKVNQ